MPTDSWDQLARPLRHYLRSCGLSDETCRTYLGNCATFWRWCADHETDARIVDRPTVRAWIAERLDQVSTSRAHNDISGLRYLFRWAKEDGLRSDDPCEGITVKRRKALPTEPITWQELDALLGVCADERDRLLLLVFCYSGMRISELAGMVAEDIDWQRGLVTVRGKGDKERRIAPNPDVLRRLRAFLGMFPTGPIWLSKYRGNPLSGHQIRKILYDIGARAGVSIHPHQMRAFFGTEYIRQFGDIQALQAMMGHSSIQTTQLYTQSTRERRGLDQMKQFGSTEIRNQQAG